MDQINFKGLSVLCEHFLSLSCISMVILKRIFPLDSPPYKVTFPACFLLLQYCTEQSFLLFTLQSRSRPQCWRKGSTKWKDVTQSLTCSWAWVEANQPPLPHNPTVLPTTRTLQTLLSWICATPQPTPHRSNVARPIWKTKQCHDVTIFWILYSTIKIHCSMVNGAYPTFL